MKTHYYDLFTRVLIYKEDDQFVAHALDFDLLGYGDTEDKAKAELEKVVQNQISFAACKEMTEMVNFPAPEEYFERWEEIKRAQLRGQLLSEKSCGLATKATVIGFPLKELRKLRSKAKRAFSKSELAFA